MPKLGKIKLKEFNYLPTDNRIINATVSERAGRWFVSVLVAEEINPPTKQKNEVGVDLGIKNLERLRRRSRQLSRKVKGGKNRRKAAKRLAKLHYKIACVRKDVIHKITTHLTKTKSKVVIEDLKISH